MWRSVFIAVVCSLIIAGGVTAGTGWIIRGGTPTLFYEEGNSGTEVSLLSVADADVTIVAGGTGTITMGNANTENFIIDSDAGMSFAENDESIINNADGTFDFTREEAGVVTITASDDSDPVTGMVIDPTGAGSMAFGSADVTTFTLTNNGAITVG